MSIALVCFGWMLLFTTPTAVVLSVCIVAGGCLWPISSKVRHWGTASQALMKRAPGSASAADDMTALMGTGMLSTAPLSIGSAMSDDRKIWPPAWLRALLGLLR